MIFASYDAFGEFFEFDIFDGLLFFQSDVHKVESVPDQISFYFFVQRGVDCEAGSVVDLKEHGLAVMCEDDIQAEDFKTHVVLKTLRLAGVVMRAQNWLDTAECLYNHFFNLAPQIFNVKTQF